MVMTDPIADFFTRIRNGYLAGKKVVVVPFSNMKATIGKILVREGYLKKVAIEGKKPQEKKIVVTLKYQRRQPVVNGLKRISKPGVKTYAKKDKIPRVRLGYGILILSTSQGLMTDKEARKKKIGGEIIAEIW